MLIEICKSKIHRATLTHCDINYIGSITIDEDLMKLANLVEYEKVQVANINNGERLETYVIKGEAGSGTIGLNGAAAHKGKTGDLVIIIGYGLFEKAEAEKFSPSMVHVDGNNRPVSD